MTSQTFYYGLLGKYITAFGSLFNELYVPRFNGDSTLHQQFKVPVAYGPREKWEARNEGDPTLSRAYATITPRISFVIDGFRYDSARQKSPVNVIRQKHTTNTNKNYYDRVFEGVPFNIDFKVVILAKAAEDAHKIVEQIIPRFQPDTSFTLHPLEDMPDYHVDIPVVMHEEISYTDNYDEGHMSKERRIEWELNFTMKVYFWGPIQKAKVIKIATVNLYGTFEQENADVIITTRPGLTANGEPTTNAAESIPVYKISENDNYGYIITIEEPNL